MVCLQEAKPFLRVARGLGQAGWRFSDPQAKSWERRERGRIEDNKNSGSLSEGRREKESMNIHQHSVLSDLFCPPTVTDCVGLDSGDNSSAAR